MSYTVARVACSCKHEWQDRTYGNGVRIANKVDKANLPKGQIKVRCSVCTKEQVISEGRMR